MAEEITAFPLRGDVGAFQGAGHRFYNCASRGQAGDRSALSNEYSPCGTARTIMPQITGNGIANIGRQR
jgi:hypothetical protein